MRSIRKGNDVRNLEILVSRLSVPVTNWDEILNLKVSCFERSRKNYLIAPAVMFKEDGKLRLYFEGNKLSEGVYDLLITFSITDPVMPDAIEDKAIDIQNIFRIVPTTAQEVDSQDPFAVDLNFAKDGLDYYHIWSQYHEGTIEDMFAWHRQPAVDAAAEIRQQTNEFILESEQRIDGLIDEKTIEVDALITESTSQVNALMDEMANHPVYIGQDHYVYIWNRSTKAYDKTDIYCKGDAFSISKVYASVAVMIADFGGIDTKAGDFVLIETGDNEDPDNSKLYVKTSTEWAYLTDLSGAIGFTGKTPQLSIGTVTTGAPGSAVTVTISEDGIDGEGNPKFKLNFAIPQGAKGDTGEKGETGETGKSAYQDYFDNTTDDPKLSQAEWNALQAEMPLKELERQANEQTRIDNEAGRAAAMALKADHGYSSNPKTLKEVEDLLRELAGAPDVFGFRYLIDQADDRVEAVNDVVYDYATGVAPAGSKRAKLLSKLRPFQCNLDGSNKEFLQDDVRMTVGWKPSDLTNPLKLQMVQIPRFYFRSFQHEGYNYVLFSEVAPEAILPFSDATQWKEIQPCGYARYRGIRQLVEGQQMLLSYSGQFPTASVSLINLQTSAKNTNVKATVTPYFIYEAITLLMTMEFGRRNAQAFYTGITNASTSYANAAVTGVTDVLTTPSGEVDVEWQPGSFTKQFRWRFIECVYGQIWNLLTGIYYVYDAATDLNKVYMTRDFGKINTNSNYAEHVLIGSTPSVNGWIKEFIPGTIVASELGGSSTTYAADYNYTSATTTTRIALAGGHSARGGNAGPFTLTSNYSPATADAPFGASLVLPE